MRGRKIRQEKKMSEPLFLQSVMQEKIWGGTKLHDEFGYDIPSEKIGEYWAISAHPMEFQRWQMVVTREQI